MTIRDYIKKYGNKTFKEVEFNNVDNCLFSYLAYLNLYDIVSSSSINNNISGIAWLDKNRDGKRDDSESKMCWIILYLN